VAAQRLRGGHLSFVPNSSLLGGVIVPASSPIRRLADLRDRRLGVAGGAADKSWLIVRAAARRAGLDLAVDANLSYGAPPLLGAMLQDGRLDALLTFWNFAARLQAAGFREAIGVDDCARQIGLSESPVLLGWVFDDRWAAAHRAAAQGFLAAALAACDFLAHDPAEWAAIRPLMDAPDQALFENLRGRFIAGLSRPNPAAMRAQATRLLGLLAEDGASRGSATLPPGVFWQATGSG
jgi:NitT/TauT family transport system substrate-binding protein